MQTTGVEANLEKSFGVKSERKDFSNTMRKVYTTLEG